jgi:alpha/beta superfamily hydrolase
MIFNITLYIAFLKRGLAVFIYDHRNHGISGGWDRSYGYYEKFDLEKCTDWVFNKLGKDIIVGILVIATNFILEY